MQQITFTSSFGTVKINDCNTSDMNGVWNKLWLNDFDGNSQALSTDAVECIGIPGQRVLYSAPKAKNITAKIGFAPLYRSQNAIICTGEEGKYRLRRELLKLFPLGEVGELIYSNSYGKYRIRARLSEVPKVNYVAGAYAEATLNFIADYPYWTYPLAKSEEVVVTASSNGVIIPTRSGDISSPVEVIVECTETITASDNYSRRLKIAHTNVIGAYLQGVNCYVDIPAGTVLKYDIGTTGELVCYKKNASGSWEQAPEYWSIQGYERNVSNNTLLEPFSIVVSSGVAKVKIIYHDIVIAI